MIKAYERKIRLDAEQKLARRTTARRIQRIRRERGLAYRAGAKKSEVGVERSSKSDLIDKDKLCLHALTVKQNAVDVATSLRKRRP